MRLPLALLLLATTPAFASSAPSAPGPDLRGSWKSDTYNVYFLDATRPGEQTVTITEQQGEVIRGNHAWHQTTYDPAVGTVGDSAPVTSATEPFVGILDFDGRTLHLAEQGDGGLITLKLVDADTMEMVYVEAGKQATAFRTRLHRQR